MHSPAEPLRNIELVPLVSIYGVLTSQTHPRLPHPPTSAARLVPLACPPLPVPTAATPLPPIHQRHQGRQCARVRRAARVGSASTGRDERVPGDGAGTRGLPADAVQEGVSCLERTIEPELMCAGGSRATSLPGYQCPRSGKLCSCTRSTWTATRWSVWSRT